MSIVNVAEGEPKAVEDPTPFRAALDKYFAGDPHRATLSLLQALALSGGDPDAASPIHGGSGPTAAWLEGRWGVRI
jgi:hypothetical protein